MTFLLCLGHDHFKNVRMNFILILFLATVSNFQPIYSFYYSNGHNYSTSPLLTALRNVSTNHRSPRSPSPPATPTRNICSNPFGYYANPADSQCQSFIRCAHGTPYVISCPAGTVYNPDAIQCGWASEYQCPGTGGNPTTTAADPYTPPATTSGGPPPVTTAPSPLGVQVRNMKMVFNISALGNV